MTIPAVWRRKRLELIREIVPRPVRIAVLANQANPVTVAILLATESAARQVRMKLHVVDVRQPAELEAAFATMRREHTDALVLVADPFGDDPGHVGVRQAAGDVVDHARSRFERGRGHRRARGVDAHGRALPPTYVVRCASRRTWLSRSSGRQGLVRNTSTPPSSAPR